MSSFGGGANNNTNGSVANDVELAHPPDDDISQIVFAPSTPHLASSSWDGEVRVYDVPNNAPVTNFKMTQPALGCAWHPDGTKLFGFGAGGDIQMKDLNANGPVQTIGSHKEPIMSGRAIVMDGNQVLATASLDKTIRYWDIRQAPYSVMGELVLPERPYAIDTQGQLLVAALADRQISVINLSEPTKIYRNINTNLKWQLRSIACFPDSTGFAVGSIEGRCAIQYIEEAIPGRDNKTGNQQQKTFSFKCHRIQAKGNEPAKVYPVNAIAFHPVYRTFATAGGDGTFHYWDKDSRHRLRAFEPPNPPTPPMAITSVAFNHTGDTFAYALSYDWGQGASEQWQRNHADRSKARSPKIMLHATPPSMEELKPRIP